MMTIAACILLVVAGFTFYFLINKKKNLSPEYSSEVIDRPDELAREHSELLRNVSFYTSLNKDEQKIFEREIDEFLSKVNIVGVDTEVEELDKILIASSAVIPLFAFPEWFYPNLMVVELYKDAFNRDFETNGLNRRIMGMVGGGVMNGRMALSQKSLRMGFSNETDKRNTAIHEFVHLIDKADGAADGVPEILFDKHQVLPWLEYIREKIIEINAGDSDIDRYGGTSEVEFFAVAAEYFFERPQLFEKKHPQLFARMVKAFRREPVIHPRPSISLPGRNDLCYCGSGKKFKYCHGK